MNHNTRSFTDIPPSTQCNCIYYENAVFNLVVKNFISS